MTLSHRLQVKPGSRVDLNKIDPDATAGWKNKESAQETLQKNIERLAKLQYKMYADNRYALLIVLQGMDAAGKDGTVRHVMSGLNPQGCNVVSFKAPTAEELEHDFLWRVHRQCPRRGELGIFNRSHYEDVLIVRVDDLVPKHVWKQRYDQINRFEKNLSECGTIILKFFLHIGKDEQKERLLERLKDPTKNWKVGPADGEVRTKWDEYMEAYSDALARCSTAWAPWYIIPANRKWFRNLAVSQIIVETLSKLDLRYPKPACDLSKIKIV